ncbi:MAG: FecR family protein [Candidatus Omnitrophota bacterium]
MMKQPLHNQEAESYERYRQSAAPRTEDEAQAFGAYAAIHAGLRNRPLPDFDANELAKRMTDAATLKSRTDDSFSPFRAAWHRILPYASAASIAVCLFVLAMQFLSMRQNGIASASYQFHNSAAEIDPSFFWKMRLQSGSQVTVPPQADAQIAMTDGSTLRAAAGAQFSIRFGGERRIRFDRGSLWVQAAKDRKHPLIVSTPLADVIVTGTSFRIEVIP